MPSNKPYTVFSKKDKLKFNQELLKLHKKTVITYLMQKDLSLSKRKKFFILYDLWINSTNIQVYFFLPVRILVKVIVLDQVKNINKYLRKHGRNIKKGTNKSQIPIGDPSLNKRKIPIERTIGSIIAKPKY